MHSNEYQNKRNFIVANLEPVDDDEDDGDDDDEIEKKANTPK